MTPKQERFVQEYLIDLNATQAAVRAGYSAKTAEQIAYENLRKPEIAAAIQKAQEARAVRTGITQDRVLTELELLAFSDLTHFTVDDNGDVKLISDAPAGAMRALQSIKRRIMTKGSGFQKEVTREVEIRLWDKPGMLKLAGQHVGLLVEKHEHKVQEMRPLIIDRVSTRAEMLAALGNVDTDAGADDDDSA
jgi:phage terminase small subunit